MAGRTHTDSGEAGTYTLVGRTEGASQSVEHYMKAILAVGRERGTVSVTAIGERLGVAPSSAVDMLRKLARDGLVEYTPHRPVRLTRPGRLLALEVVRHHRLLELFLQKVLGYRMSEVHEEADRLEHALSEVLENRIDELLGYPEIDPHGSPIPAENGTVAHRPQAPLAQTQVGETVQVTELTIRDRESLEALEEAGLLPGVQVTVLASAASSARLELRIADGAVESVDRELCRSVWVQSDRERRQQK